MKWLLITNNSNPGDIWVRLGIQSIIRHFDNNPTWLIRERDFRHGDKHKGLTEPKEKLEFDYSVVCGMPLVWSHLEPDGQKSNTIQHKSWIPLTTWLKPEKMIIAGFGVFLLCPHGLDEYQMVDQLEVLHAIQELFDKCLLVYSRSPFSRVLFRNVASLHCPSVLAVKPAGRRDLKLCNFMPGGGHYPHLAPNAAEAMTLQMPSLARKLLSAGFHFVAHTEAERELALELGWEKGKIFAWKPDGTGDKLLEVYGRCAKYFGNRIHGAIVSRAVGAEVMVVGYDTRLAAVKYMGGQICTPFTIPKLDSWISSQPKPLPYNSSTVREIHKTWWSTNLHLPVLN